jgi:hypothetical protein
MCDDEKGIDVVMSGDRNVIKRGAEKILKYKDCTIEIELMWTVNTSDNGDSMGNWNRLKITETVPEQHTGKGQNKELQKTALLDTAHCWKF